MNRLTWLAIPALLSACTVTTDTGDEPGTGSVDFTWTFSAPNGGSTCADADVQQIQLTLAGGTPVTVPCNDWQSGDGQSATIDDVPSGALSYTIAGLSFTYDDNGNVTGQVTSYSGTFNTTVTAGAVDEENITLTPLSTTQNNSNIILLWTFAGDSCATAGVSMVTITITDPVGGNVDSTVACTENGTDGASVGASASVPGSTGFTAGSYPFTLSAAGASTQYYASGTLFANGYSDTSAHIDLGVGSTGVPSGSGNLTTNFSFGTSDFTCATSGVTQLEYYLTDDTGAVVSGTFANVPCTDPSSGQISATFTGLNSPATYFLNAEGQAGGATTYELLQYAVEVYPDSTSVYSVEVPAIGGL